MKKAVKWLLEHGGAALFLDPGLGKTSITLAAVKILLKAELMDRALIIAPLRVIYDVWPREIQKWNDFQHIRYKVLHGKDKELSIREDADVYLVNPEGLEWVLSNWKVLKPDTLIIDESTKFKNGSSKRFKLLKPFIPKFRRRWILTGTPAPLGLLDLFAQMYIVDEGRSLGRYITHYRNKYFDSCGFGGYDWRIKPGADKLIYNAVKPYALRLKAEDFINLPEMLENDVLIHLPTKAYELYLRMEETAFAELDTGGYVNATHAASALSKCRQICNGAVYTEDGKWEAVHTAKLEALESIIEERGGKPVLVAYEFTHDYQHACAHFKNAMPLIGGGVNAKTASRYVDQWNAGELPVLWVHPASAGHGLNMQEYEWADCIVWFTPPYDLEQYDQLNRRLRRTGSKAKRIVVHRLVGEGTADYAALRALERKTTTQNSFLDALKTYRARKR